MAKIFLPIHEMTKIVMTTPAETVTISSKDNWRAHTHTHRLSNYEYLNPPTGSGAVLQNMQTMHKCQHIAKLEKDHYMII
jgi:hypothetical protein